ncbi:hypothetical protein XaraCFBP7407_19400 [Xanthomonas arboricola pv. arracaciae]|nr:hypothetical protein XaraCFBP7407_19400 [Xanthomonas arboricola pv. arracaciae]
MDRAELRRHLERLDAAVPALRASSPGMGSKIWAITSESAGSGLPIRCLHASHAQLCCLGQACTGPQ